MAEPKRRTCGECHWWVAPRRGVNRAQDEGFGECHYGHQGWTAKPPGDFCSRHWPADGSWGDPLTCCKPMHHDLEYATERMWICKRCSGLASSDNEDPIQSRVLHPFSEEFSEDPPPPNVPPVVF